MDTPTVAEQLWEGIAKDDVEAVQESLTKGIQIHRLHLLQAIFHDSLDVASILLPIANTEYVKHIFYDIALKPWPLLFKDLPLDNTKDIPPNKACIWLNMMLVFVKPTEKLEKECLVGMLIKQYHALNCLPSTAENQQKIIQNRIFIQRLMAAQFDINFVFPIDKINLFQIAACYRDTETLNLLLAKKATIIPAQANGFLPLVHAKKLQQDKNRKHHIRNQTPIRRESANHGLKL
jgi:hypothetical protein